MSDPLDKIESLARAATPGPWEPHEAHDIWMVRRRGGPCYVAQTGSDGDLSPCDARYIAALSPDVVLGLLEEVRRLRACEASLIDARQCWADDYAALRKAKAENDERFMVERDEARAEVERLRSLLRDLSVGPMADAYIAMRKAVDEFKPEVKP